MATEKHPSGWHPGGSNYVPQGVYDYANEYGIDVSSGLHKETDPTKNGYAGTDAWVGTDANGNTFTIAGDAHNSTYYQDHPGALFGVSDADWNKALATDGYITNSRGQRVNIHPGGPGTAGMAVQPDPSGAQAGTQAQRDALALIQNTLAQYGLPASLGEWAWREIQGGKSEAEVMLDLQQRPEYKNEFPEIDARLKAGLAPLSPGDIIGYRQQARQIMSAAGLPQGFYDSKDDFTKFLANDVSLNELNDRIQMAKDASYNIPAEVKNRLASEFGITPGSGELTAYFLDDKKALPLLQRDFQAGRIGGAADRVGYGGVSNDTARSLADLGVSEQQAQQGFNDLAGKSELMLALPGQGEDTIDQQAQLGAEFGGNINAQRRIENRQRRRVAEFQGGGDFASTQQGLVGLGRADR